MEINIRKKVIITLLFENTLPDTPAQLCILCYGLATTNLCPSASSKEIFVAHLIVCHLLLGWRRGGGAIFLEYERCFLMLEVFHGFVPYCLSMKSFASKKFSGEP